MGETAAEAASRVARRYGAQDSGGIGVDVAVGVPATGEPVTVGEADGLAIAADGLPVGVTEGPGVGVQ
jgi:hypothetical protein